MRISTMEQLDRVPIGDEVFVTDVAWTRSEGGLTQGNTTLPLLAFRAYAEKGRIRTNVGFAEDVLPQWRTNSSTSWLVVGEEPGGNGYLCIRFGYESFDRIEAVSYEQITRFDEATGPSYTLAPQAWTAALSALMERVTPAFLGGGAVTGDLVDALHDYAKEHEDLDPLLAEHGVGRQRKGEVVVVANGTATVAAEQFAGVEIEEEPVVKWKFTYTVPAISNITDPCLCVSFDEADYMSRLPQNVVDEEHSFTCTEEDCVNK